MYVGVCKITLQLCFNDTNVKDQFDYIINFKINLNVNVRACLCYSKSVEFIYCLCTSKKDLIIVKSQIYRTSNVGKSRNGIKTLT